MAKYLASFPFCIQSPSIYYSRRLLLDPCGRPLPPSPERLASAAARLRSGGRKRRKSPALSCSPAAATYARAMGGEEEKEARWWRSSRGRRRRPMEGRGRRRPWEGRGSRRPWEGGRGRRIGVGDAGDLGKGGWELLRPSLLSAAGGHRPSLGGRGEWRKRSRIGKEFWAMGRGEQQPHQATCLALPLGGRDEAAPCSVPMGLLCSMVALVEFGTVSCCRLRRALGLVSPSH